MFTRINELFVLGGPVEAASIGGLSGFLAASIIVLFNLGATLAQRVFAMALLFAICFILLTSGLNAVRESRAQADSPANRQRICPRAVSGSIPTVARPATESHHDQ